MAVSFKDLSSAEGVKQLDEYLTSRSYISGYQASRDDLAVYSALKGAPSAENKHAARWYNHITVLLGHHFPGEGVGVTIGSGATSSSSAPAAAAPSTPAAAPAKPAADDDDDDDMDLFGEQTEEEKKAQEDRAAATKKSDKPKVVGKSSILLDVKPWDDETDLAKMEEVVRSVQMEGLTWGASKLVPVGYGIKKMTIMMTIVDDLVSLDELIEDRLQAGEGADFIQSCDIVAFNKI
eukprot:jgi/Mesen1/2786/ME000170S01901